MSIPDYQSIMKPILEVLKDGKEMSLRVLVEKLAEKMNVSEDDLNILLPSGTQPLFNNRVGWARTYLKQSGCIMFPKRGYTVITDRGKQLLSSGQDIDNNSLKQFDEFNAFLNRTRRNQEEQVSEAKTQTPDELIAEQYQTLKQKVKEDILEKVIQCTPDFFERLVLDLILAMGYGGGRKDAGQLTSKTGDEGIDGIINEDALGLEVIYIQAKRWKSPVGRPEIQKFAGALLGKQTRKGIFITTSEFSQNAITYAKSVDSNIILIDGYQLAEMMFDYNIGVSEYQKIIFKKIDTDYFEEE